MKKSNIFKLILAGAGIGAGIGIVKNKDKIIDAFTADNDKEEDPLEGLTEHERDVINTLWSFIPLDEVEDYVTVSWLRNMLEETGLLTEISDECSLAELEDEDRLVDKILAILLRHMTVDEKIEAILSIVTDKYCEDDFEDEDDFYDEEDDETDDYFDDIDY